jgi:peptidoglycan/LPS O-acetylase OafA/YrhL
METNGWDQLHSVRVFLSLLIILIHALYLLAFPFGLVSDTAIEIAIPLVVILVFIFFLMSGLVIGRSLVSNAKRGDRAFVTFMSKRIARIYPPLLFSIVLTSGLAIILRLLKLDHYVGPGQDLARLSFSYLEGWWDILIALATFGFGGALFQPGPHGTANGALWTLVLEMQEYAIAGLVAQLFAARSTWVRVASSAAVIGALYALSLREMKVHYLICHGLFALGLALSFLPLRFPRVIPVVSLDFSYSLYVVHFPIMLFVFFLMCQGTPPPSPPTIYGFITISLIVSIIVGVISRLLFERKIEWTTGGLKAPTGAAS